MRHRRGSQNTGSFNQPRWIGQEMGQGIGQGMGRGMGQGNGTGPRSKLGLCPKVNK